MRKIPPIVVGFVALMVLGACSSPTPDEACAEYGKKAVPLGVSEDGFAMYNCVPSDLADDQA